MRNYGERKDKIETDAIEGILLLKKEQKIKKVLLGRFYENNKESDGFDIYEKKFRIREGDSIGLFYYFYLEKTWFLFRERGSIKINGKRISNSGVLRNNTFIEIGPLGFYFEIKHIVRKEYKKLLVEVILDSPRKKLSLSEIYEKLLESYGFSQEKKLSWKNSIRCVLSESKVFYKVAKEIKYGRGSFWCVCKEELEIMDRETIKKCERKLSEDFFFQFDCPVYEKRDLFPDLSDISSNDQHSPQRANIENYVPHTVQRSPEQRPVQSDDNKRPLRRSRNSENPEHRPATVKAPASTYLPKQTQIDYENIINQECEGMEITSLDGYNPIDDEISSEMSCLSIKPKRHCKRR